MRVDFPRFETLNERALGEQAAAFYDLVIAPVIRLLKGQS